MVRVNPLTDLVLWALPSHVLYKARLLHQVSPNTLQVCKRSLRRVAVLPAAFFCGELDIWTIIRQIHASLRDAALPFCILKIQGLIFDLVIAFVAWSRNTTTLFIKAELL